MFKNQCICEVSVCSYPHTPRLGVSQSPIQTTCEVQYVSILIQRVYVSGTPTSLNPWGSSSYPHATRLCVWQSQTSPFRGVSVYSYNHSTRLCVRQSPTSLNL
ncbi:unnamed protein product [Ectocarpus sp. CCAP 1310/34]|nr:unnamed protein product [Ectocarpus sp. CCAP 1310/34]